MDEEHFWGIVEGARAEMGGDSELVAQAVLRRLRALPPDGIGQFQLRWEDARDEVYRWPILDAATLLLGSSGDLREVQDWIVSHGRGTIRRVQEDPDSLVELASDRHNAPIDWFSDLTTEAHIAAVGAPCEVESSPGLYEPEGTPAALTDEASARRRFPRLTAYLDDNRGIPRPWDSPAD